MDVKRYMKTSVYRNGATTPYNSKPCLLHTCETAPSNFTANLNYRPLKKLFSVLELGWYEGQTHLETGLIIRVHTRWSNKTRKDGGYWAITDRQREEGGQRGSGRRERGGERERFLLYMKQLHISYFVSISSYFLSAYCDSLCIYLDFSRTFSLSVHRQHGQQSAMKDLKQRVYKIWDLTFVWSEL